MTIIPPKNYNLKRTIALIIIFTLIAILAGIGIFSIVTDKDPVGSAMGVTKDSGVAACEQMAKNAKDNAQINSGSPMTEAKVAEAKKPWESSKYADVRVAGTNMIATVYQMEKESTKNDGDPTIVFVMLSTLQTQWGALQTACSNHGVTIPPLPMGGN